MTEANASAITRVVFLDTETSGVNPETDFTIEVAVTLFDVQRAQPIASFASLIRAPQNEAFVVNGIPEVMLSEAREADEVWRCVKWLISPGQLIVAHQAAFDRSFCPPLEKPWACTIADFQFPGVKQTNHLLTLALGLGVGVVNAHRAMADVDTLVRVFMRLAEKGVDIEKLFQLAIRPKTRVVSLAPFEQKDIVKQYGFQWDKDRKQWWRDIPPEDIEKLPFKVRRGTLP